MAKPAPIGTKGSFEQTVEFKHTHLLRPPAAASAFHPGHDPVHGDGRVPGAAALL